MAEASVDSMVTPEKDKSDDRKINKDSAGKQDSSSDGRSTDTRPLRASVGHGSLRSSADKSGSADGSKKVVPHYLRASTGSCHDFCKYGKHNSDESKARKPLRKRVPKLSPDQIPVEILVSGGKKKKEVVAGGETKREVVAGGEKKGGTVSGSEVKEEVVAGGEMKGEMVSGDAKKGELVSGGEKGEVVSGAEKGEVVSGAEKKGEVVSGDEKEGEVVSGDEKEGELVSGDEKKGEVVSGGEKGEVVSGDEKKIVVVSGAEKKEEVISHGPPVDAKGRSTGQKPSLDTKSHPTKLKTSLSKEKVTKLKPSTHANSPSPTVPSPNNKSDLRKPKSSSYTKTYPSKQNDSSGSKTLLSKSKSSSAKKSPSADPPEIVKSVFFPYTEVEDSAKQGSSTRDKISRTEKKATSMAKQLTSPVKLKPVKVKPSSAPDDSDGKHGKGGRISNTQTSRKLITAKPSMKKISTPPSATLPYKLPLKKTAQITSRTPGNLKLASPLKDRIRLRKINTKASESKKVTEKTLHVMETGNNVSESIPGGNVMSSPQSTLSAESSSHGKSVSSSYEDDNLDSEESAVKTDKIISKKSLESCKEAPVKESPKKTMRKGRVVVPEAKHVSPVKVKFRMGKVVELQTDNNTPRKLRFRRARVLGVEESKGDLRRKTTRKAGITSDTAGTGITSQKVVLKHQDVQGKKDAQGLLNNVIEETASKLVHSRKSKVKALVGAFETVISLQESKPSTQVVV